MRAQLLAIGVRVLGGQPEGAQEAAGGYGDAPGPDSRLRALEQGSSGAGRKPPHGDRWCYLELSRCGGNVGYLESFVCGWMDSCHAARGVRV